MKNKNIITFVLLSLTLSSCMDDAVQNFRTAEEDGITAFLKKDPDRYSEFLKLMEAAGVDALLDARGNYTCFVPVNEAVRRYYAEKNADLDQMTEETIKEIVYSHIIRQENPSDDPLTTDLFPNGTIGLPNMLGKFIQTTYDSLGNIYVNQTAKILIPDQDKEEPYKIYNGVIHTIDGVLEPSRGRISGLLAEQARYSLFVEALRETGLIDSLEAYINENYDRRRKAGEIPDEIISLSTFNNKAVYANKGGSLNTPASWLIGFTVLMESDEVYKRAGIQTLNDLRQYAETHVVPDFPDTYNDLTDRRNSLNRFIAYHILDRTMDVSDFIPASWLDIYYTKDAAELGVIVDYSGTLDPYGIVEIRRDATGAILNRRSDGSAVRILTESGNVSENGMFHGLDRILVYDVGVESDVLNKRLRMDVTSLLPELHTNRIKGNAPYGKGVIFPQGYLKNMVQLTENTQIQYGGAMLNEGWNDLHLDEILIAGKYDLMLRLPPLPEATYEIRIGYTANQKRGVLQISLDGKPLGIPLDMTKEASDPAIGYVKPGDDENDPYGYENDKMMRNRGYMKAPSTIYGSSDGNDVLRTLARAVRRILTTARLDRGEHWLHFKSVEDIDTREFMFDYLELVPSSAYPDRNDEGVE
ncbi:MAG: fasciclin domain-containing protein [Dysgonamonadaceae bacterium]|nr:fasciclin domain-containing protein [Dysgonamonadaceae bacterium]